MPLFLFPYCELAVPRVERRFYQNPRKRVNTIFQIFSLQVSQCGRAATQSSYRRKRSQGRFLFERKPSSNLAFLAVFRKEFLREQINRRKRRYRRFSKSEITTFVSFVASCKNSLRCIHFMRRRTNSAPKSSVRQSKSTGTKGQG